MSVVVEAHVRPLLTGADRIEEEIGDRVPAFFLDLDGTLAPMAPRPELVVVPDATKRILEELSAEHVVCVVSGRGLEDLQDKMGLPSLYYAADHGYRIAGPPGSAISLRRGEEHREELLRVARELYCTLAQVDGVIVEVKDVSLSVHYRLVGEQERPTVSQAVMQAAKRSKGLQLEDGKLVHELRPSDQWNKGSAVLWLLDRLGLDHGGVCPVCLGDDLTDEDMFAVTHDWGVTVIVGSHGRPTLARSRVGDHSEAAALLGALAARRH